ncbi:MAG: cohesin domain-containing protein [Xenococcaceae cyanobacterium MO_188.B19]|nr:cohesin domain-containing protein [Xenococcaceae cyanobacterium MO_188.B19]
MNTELSNQVLDSNKDSLSGNPINILETEVSSVSLSVDSLTGLPGDTVTVPILISDGAGVVSLNLLLKYDPNVLSIPDPDTNTDENERIRRAGISETWVSSEGSNPTANVNSETGEVNISLFKTDTAANPTSDRVLEIDFLISDDATLDSTTSIDLQSSQGDSTSRIGIGSQDLLLTDSVLSDGDITFGQSTVLDTQINRFQNKDRPGTFLFANEGESVTIRRDFPNFDEEGPAFKVSQEAADGLIRLNRFQNENVPGTYLFATEGESVNIRRDFPNFKEEGVAFYVYGADANKGVDYFRFQSNNNPGTYVFVNQIERDSILANFPNDFTLEGVAFEVEPI